MKISQLSSSAAFRLLTFFLVVLISSRTAAQVSCYANPAGSTPAPHSTDQPGYLSLPFEEAWDQGFTANDWLLPAPENNWIIDTAVGNPPPCANFRCQPYRVYFSQALTSDTLDAIPYTCASLWFDFDLKINAYNTLGDEVFKVEIYREGSWKTLAVFNDHHSTDWVSYHINIDSARGQSFRLRFVAEGTNSADVSNWFLDNVRVTPECKAPRNLWGFFTYPTTHLTWKPPDCSAVSGTTISLIFDDGTWENGWRMNAGAPGWFGNEFQVFSTGILQEVSLYFVDNGSGSAKTMSVDVFDIFHNLIGSSAPFNAAPANAWIDVPMPPIPFYDDFFAMVRFDSLPGNSYFLATDENGPWAADDLAWNIDANGNWAKASTLGSNPCVFLCRATIFAYGDTQNTGDSATLLGYDLYRSQLFFAMPYDKVNTTLLTDTSYYDYNVGWPWFKYYVTTVYRNNADSSILCEPASTIIAPGYIGINDLNGGMVSLAPNPASDRVTVCSPGRIRRIAIFDLTGIMVMNEDLPGNDRAEIDVLSMNPGIYLAKIITNAGIFIEKLVINQRRD